MESFEKYGLQAKASRFGSQSPCHFAEKSEIDKLKERLKKRINLLDVK